MGQNDSESPVRVRGSPRRRSPSRKERSPARYKSSAPEKRSTRNRSPQRAWSRSPVRHSPTRDKPSSQPKSPRRRRSPSPVSLSPVRQRPPKRTRSPKRVKSRSSPPLSPIKEKLPSRTKSPKRVKERSLSPENSKPSNRTKSPRNVRSRSPASRSPSPRSKRLRKAKAERDAGRGSEGDSDRNHNRKGDKATHRERDSDRDMPVEKKEKLQGRNAVNNGSSRSRNGRSASPADHHRSGQRRSRSPSAANKRGRDELTSSRDAEQCSDENDSLAKMKAAQEALEAKEKHKPSFELSGKLAAETNRFRGVTLLFNEPPDARKPDVRWRLYVFKGGEVLNEPLYIHRNSCYLFGRERRVADIPTDHPSCSKQHAVLQYRQVDEENPDGTTSKKVRPYLMDLGSTNGTFINDSQIEPQRYYELFEKDTIKFGNSSREYVLLHENSAS